MRNADVAALSEAARRALAASATLPVALLLSLCRQWDSSSIVDLAAGWCSWLRMYLPAPLPTTVPVTVMLHDIAVCLCAACPVAQSRGVLSWWCLWQSGQAGTNPTTGDGHTAARLTAPMGATNHPAEKIALYLTTVAFSAWDGAMVMAASCALLSALSRALGRGSSAASFSAVSRTSPRCGHVCLGPWVCRLASTLDGQIASED